MYIQLEPLLALAFGLAALLAPPRLGARVVGAYLVLWAVLVFLGHL